MSIKINDLRNMINAENVRRGYQNAKYNTVGALTLYHDACGYAVNEICTVGGGVRRLCGTGTKNECAAYLYGMRDAK